MPSSVWFLTILSIVFGGVSGAIFGYYAIYRSLKNKVGELLEAARKEAAALVDEAKIKADHIKARAREEALKIREKILEELTEKKLEVERLKAKLEAEEKSLLQEKRYLEKQEKELNRRIQSLEKDYERRIAEIEKRLVEIEKIRQELEVRERSLEEREKMLEDAFAEVDKRLQEVAGMTPEEARDILFKNLSEELSYEIGKKIQEFEESFKDKAGDLARKILLEVMGRIVTDTVPEATISTVAIPNEEMKGRIIGREGRNIRAFESITGVDLLIDDTPDVVVISSFDPVRREIARRTLVKLVKDGRIHPAKIEEFYEKSREEVEEEMRKRADEALTKVGIRNIHPELKKIIGRLYFRYSYGQNILYHSIEVAQIAGYIAAELGLDVDLAKRAAFLHDIGKGIVEQEGSHALVGAEYARKYKESDIVVNAIASHHGEEPPLTPYAVITQIADAVSAARPGARYENYEFFIKRLRALEEIAKSVNGVKDSFAIQAGRELRIIVDPEVVTDAEAYKIARDVAQRVEEELTYPGQIKVTVIRETRAVEYAK
ncbi:MAG TPA: ribonuclease Y [Thermotoga sp.]|nr:ribonuclease Y [Thermotoga sp.]